MPRGDTWRYATQGPPAGPGWETPGFDDASWSEGRAPFGYGEDRLGTELGRPAEGDPNVVAWFRRGFEVEDAAAVQGLVLELVRDDGAIVYLNGREVLRNNLPPGDLDSETRARRSVGGDAERRALRLALPAALLRDGRNLLAVAVHQSTVGSSDLLFDLALVAYGPDDPVELLRGPYLQQVTPTSAVVRFTTSRPVLGRVRSGEAPDGLVTETNEAGAAVHHQVALAGLRPGARVFYAVEAEGVRLAGGDEDHAFSTPPRPGDPAGPVRIWVTGDPGTGADEAFAVRDGYLEWTQGRPADLWLTLGDNAYPSGSPSDWQAGFFDVYAPVLAGTPVWPALGNHDLKVHDPLTGEVPFFELMTLPREGEAGGTPSGSEAWYSFDYGPVHVVVLDTAGSDVRPGSPQVEWLKRDLASRQGEWLLVAFHHPPFSRGTHAGDREDSSARVRAYLVPLLEAADADLVLAGHSHAYERSYPLHGPHPGKVAGDPGRVLDERPGYPEGDGPYRKAGRGGGDGPAPDAGGTVYVVAGSAGHTGPAPFGHPSMAVSLAEPGSLVLGIDGCHLDAAFLDAEGHVRDRFAIEKTGPCGTASR